MRRPAAGRLAEPLQRPAVGDHEVGALSFDGESRRHHADDRAGPSVRRDGETEHVRASAQPRLPELVTQEDDAVAALFVLLRRKDPAERGLHPERGEHVRRRQQAGDLFGLTVQHHVDPRRTDHAEVVERFVALAPRHEIRRCDHVARVAVEAVLPDHDDAVRIGIRQRLEHDAADDAEDRGGCADPERQRQHGRNGKARRAQKRPHGKAQVLHQHEGLDAAKCATVGIW